MSRRFAYLFERFPSFVQSFCIREVQEMVRQGADPLVLSIRTPDDPPHLAVPLDFPVTYLPPEKELRLEIDRRYAAREIGWWIRRVIKRHREERDSQRLFEAAYLAPLLRATGIRHVHAHFGGLAARTAWWLSKISRVTYSFTGHANDIFCEHDTPITNAMLVQRARLVVTETDFAREWMERRHPRARGKIVRVYNGLALPAARPPHPFSDPPRLLSIGRYVEKKGFADLIDACRLLRDRGFSFTCDIVGEGPLRDALQRQIEQAELTGSVTLTGPKSHAEVIALLEAADVFVLACVPDAGGGSDNLPTVVAEAMAHGVATICTKVAGVPEMIDNDIDGLLTTPGDREGLSAAMAGLLRDPAHAAELGRRATEKVRAKFSLEENTRLLRLELRKQ